MARNEKINIEVGLVTDKKALSELESSLEQIILHAKLPGNEMNQSFQQAAKTARELQTILGKTYNKDLGSVNVNKFNQELKNSHLNLQDIRNDFSKVGNFGNQAFQLIGSSILQTNIKLKQSSKFLNDMAVTFKNTVRYGISSSIFNTMANSIQRAYEFSKNLDTSLNDIRIVTGQSAEQMDLFAVKANKAAQELRATTLDFTKAALIYYQQGLGDVESQARAAVTVKTANVTGQSASDVSEQLTAVWNGYKVSADEVEYYVDKLAKVAAGTAADLEELSTGMSKVASAANNAGVDIDQMNAMLATVISVTREAPETIGTSFRTLFARMGDLKLGATDEDGVGLGKVSKQLDAIGVKVLDQEGNMRDMGDIIEDLAKKWQTLDRAQQQAAAVAIGGKMQYSRLIALMDNWDMYTDAINMSKNAIGTLQEQQEIYEQSTEAQLNKLQATWEDFYMSLIKSDEIGSGIGVITNIVKTFDNFIEAFGGGGKSIIAFGTLVANVFNRQIGESIARSRTNFADFKNNLDLAKRKLEIVQAEAEKPVRVSGDTNLQTLASQEGYKEQVAAAEKLQQVERGLSQEKLKQGIQLQSDIAKKREELELAKMKLQIDKDFLEIDYSKEDSLSAEMVSLSSQINDLEIIKSASKEIQQTLERTSFTTTEINEDGQAQIVTLTKEEVLLSQIENLYNVLSKNKKVLDSSTGLKEVQADLALIKEKGIEYFKEEKALERIDKLRKTAKLAVEDTIPVLNDQYNYVEKIYNEELRLSELENDLNTSKLEFQALVDTAGIISNIEQKVQTLTGTVATFTSAWAGISMIGTTLSDSTLSGWDKFVQILSTGAFIVPSFLSAWKGFSSLLGITTTLTELHSAQQAQANAELELSVAIKAKDMAIEKARQQAMLQGLVTEEAINKAVEKDTVVIAADTAVKVANKKATDLATVANEAYATSLLGNPWLLAAAAIIAVTVAIIKYASEQKSAIEKAEIATKNAKEAAEEAKTAYENLQKSFEDYDKGVSALEELDEATGEYKSTLKETNDIILQLISNSAELAKYVTRNPKTGLLEFNPEGKQKVLEEAENKSNRLQSAAAFAEYETSVQTQKVGYQQFIKDLGGVGYGSGGYGETYLRAKGTGTGYDGYETTMYALIKEDTINEVFDMLQNDRGELIEEDLKNNLTILKKDKETLKKEIQSTGGIWFEGYQEAILNFFLENSQAFYDYTKQINDFNQQQQLLFAEGIQSYLKTNKDFSGMSNAEQYTIASLLNQQEITKTRQDLEKEWWNDWAFGGGNEDKVHEEYALLMGYDVTKTQDKVWDTANYWDSEKKEYVSVEDDVARAAIVNAKMGETLTKNIEDLRANVEKINSLTNESTSDLIMGALRGDLKYEKLSLSDYEALTELINSDAFKEGLKEVNWEALENVVYKSGEEFVKAINDNLNVEEKFRQNSIAAVTGVQGNVGNLTNDYLAGSITEKNIEENEDYKKLANQFSDLIALVPDLKDEIAVLNNTALVGTEQWIQSLYKVQDAINQITLEKKRKEFEDAWQEIKDRFGGDDDQTAIKLWIDTEDFETEINSLLNKDYAITVEIHSQAEQAFTQISTAMDNIKKQAALIGEDFIVSAENARALGNTFPGIYEQAEISATGQIKLNENVAKSAILAAQQEIEASAIETEQALQNARDEAKIKQEQYAAAAKAARAYAESNMEDEDLAAQFATEMANAVSLVKQQASEDAQTQEEKATTNSNINAEQTAKNWASSYENATKFVVKFAETAIKAQSDIANGVLTVGFNPSDFKVNYSGQNGKSAELKEIEDYTSILDANGGSKEDKKARLERLATTLDSLSDAQGKLVNDIDSMLVGLGSKRMETLNSLGQTGSTKSGGGSSKNPDKVTENADELDRYEKVNAQLEIISNNLSDIDKKKEKLFGKDYIAELNKEIAELNKQITVTNDKLKIQRDEREELKEVLKNWGLTFSEATNAEGDNQYMQNYGDIWTLKHNALVEAEQKYNKMSVEEQEAFKITLDALEEDWKDFLKKTSRYDTLIGEIHSSLENKDEAERKKIADNIEKFGLELTIRLDMQEAIKDWDKFKRDVIDDWNEIWKSNTFSKGFFDENGNWQTNLKRTAQEDLDLLKSYFYKSYESMANPGVMLQGSGLVGTQTAKLKELREEAEKAFNGQNGLFGENQYIETQTALDNLKEYKENAINTATEIKNLIDSIKGAYLGALQEATEEFSEQVDLLERANKYIEHDMKLIKLIYGDNQYESLGKYYQKQHENNLQQLDFQTKQRDFWKAQMEMAEENSDEWEYAKEQWLSAIDSANAALEQAVETAKEKWENAIDEVFEKLDRKFTDGLGLDYIKEEWSLINKNSDEYLDAINSAYGIQKLQNKYLDAIDKSTDINNQRRLNELMGSEIEYLQQIDRLTQTDLDRAELKLQIALKQMELEDAQNAKTTMRLRRDSQGNYNYQFVANQDDIDKAKEELDELYNKLYNFDLKAYRTNLDKAASAYEEFMQKMAEAAKIVNEEDRIAQETLLKEQYYEYIGMLQDENERYSTNLIESATLEHGELYEQEALDFKNMTDQEIDAFMNGLVPQWKSGVQDMIDQWSGPNGFKESVEAAVDELMEKDQEYRDDLDKIQETAGIVFDDIKKAANDTISNALDPFIQANDEILNRYEEQVKYIVRELIPKLKDLQAEYKTLIDEINKANRLQGLEYEEAANRAHDDWEGSNTPNPQHDDIALDSNPLEDENDEKGADTSVSSQGNGEVDVGDKVTLTGNLAVRSTDAPTLPPLPEYQGASLYVQRVLPGTRSPYHLGIRPGFSSKDKSSWVGWVDKDQITGYDTGGYTGTWGNVGKLAFLHQKELVLNAEDTNNFLNALDIMRNIVSNIGSEAFSRLASIGGNCIGDPAFAGIEQNVVINADFPNATDHNEIQQAFNNLMNIASQKVNRNRL